MIARPVRTPERRADLLVPADRVQAVAEARVAQQQADHQDHRQQQEDRHGDGADSAVAERLEAVGHAPAGAVVAVVHETPA